MCAENDGMLFLRIYVMPAEVNTCGPHNLGNCDNVAFNIMKQNSNSFLQFVLFELKHCTTSCLLTVWIGWTLCKIQIKWVIFHLDLIVFSTIMHRNSRWSLHWIFTLRNNPTPFSLYWNYTAVLPCPNSFGTEMNSMMFLIKLIKIFMMI